MANIMAAIKEFFAKIVAFIKGIFGGNDEDDDDINEVDKPGGDIVCYYGCPNSNKAKKLQLEKKLWN